MEIAQLSKSMIIISCTNPHIFAIREICLKYGRSTNFGRAKDKGHSMAMYTYSPQLLSYILRFLRYGLHKILKVKVTMERSKVKSRSHFDVAHVYPITNVPTMYQLPTPYSFRDIARTRFSNSRSLWQGKTSNQGHTMMLYTYNS